MLTKWGGKGFQVEDMYYIKDVCGLFVSQNDGGGYCKFLVVKSQGC